MAHTVCALGLVFNSAAALADTAKLWACIRILQKNSCPVKVRSVAD
jgi:hypothetical protein